MNVKKLAGILVAGLAVSACAPPVPNSAVSGPGFSDYTDFELQRARREAALAGPGRTDFEAQVITTPQGAAIAPAELQQAGIGAQTQATPGAPLSAIRTQSATASTGGSDDVRILSSGISDEQNFDAVASRESIESDAQRRAAQAAARRVIEPTALPTRTSGTGPNIVAYALNAPNEKGQEWYSRSIFATEGRFQRNCASYNSPDAAQRDFLARGGPERDPRGIDPDGDGFACGWDPAPFKLATGN